MWVTRSIVQSYVELIDVLAAIGIIGIVTAFALADYRNATAHAELTEASFLLPASRVDVHEYHATHGTWPGRAGVTSHFETRDANETGTRSIHVDAEAALHFTLALKTLGDTGTLSYRAAVVPENTSSPVVWICGYAAAPDGFTALGANETTFADADLPSPCRQKNLSSTSH